MSLFANHELNRRQFLQAGAIAAAAIGTRALPLSAADDPYRGFKVGIQSYSMRGMKFPEALEASKKLGLKYWESYRDHVAINTLPAYIAEKKEALAGAGIKLMAFGVVSFDSSESKAREVFDFAKAIGIESLSASPNKDEATFKLLEKLVAEYDIAIAIHNHGPTDKFNKISDCVTWVKDRHPKIGACVDTGHYLRSMENPVQALEQLKGRVFGVHLKDVKDAKVFKILGEGDLDVVGCLKELKKQNYQYCVALEYEENPQNVMPDLEICFRNLRSAMEKIG